MDFKGVSWAGNIYHKFEAMCLEVEEAMYQDTIKYVENQVQKVGVSVKKFYTEVLEDLDPPSCAGPINLASGDLPLIPYDHTDIDKKLKPSAFDSHHSLTKKKDEDLVIPNVTAEKGSPVSGCCDINSLSLKSPGVSVHNKCSDLSSKVGLQRRPVGIKRISKNHHPSKDSGRITSLSGERRRKLASSDTRSNVMLSSDLEANQDAGEVVKENAPMPSTLIESPASDKILAVELLRQNEECIYSASDETESVRQNKDDSNCVSPASGTSLLAESEYESERLKRDSGSTSSSSGLHAESSGASMKETSFSTSVTRSRSNASNLESKEREVMVSNEDSNTSMKNGSSSVCATSCNAESGGEEVIKSIEDSFNMEVIENEEVSELRQENLKAVARENLEESCILVEADKIHYIPYETKKHKSYKKKIREALALKLRSRKDLGGKNNEEVANPVLAVNLNLPARDSFESEWELL